MGGRAASSRCTATDGEGGESTRLSDQATKLSASSGVKLPGSSCTGAGFSRLNAASDACPKGFNALPRTALPSPEGFNALPRTALPSPEGFKALPRTALPSPEGFNALPGIAGTTGTGPEPGPGTGEGSRISEGGSDA